MVSDDLKQSCFKNREALFPFELKLRELMQDASMLEKDPPTVSECRANIMLAVRHLEDCRMRLRTVIEVFEGDTSGCPR